MTRFSQQPACPRKPRSCPVYPAILGAGALLIFIGCKSSDANPEKAPTPMPQGSIAMPLVSPTASGDVLAEVPMDAGVSDAGVSDAGVSDGSVRDAGRKPLPRIPHPAGGMPGPIVPGPVK